MHSYAENVFSLQVHFYTNQTHVHIKGFARGLALKTEVRGNSEMAYCGICTTDYFRAAHCFCVMKTSVRAKQSM